ncbi:unnamed protein product [Prorocentrum cordatum]|uniref:Uncharacterized protein n=1 Tax=Prorocentrum cordatum TaxID=2364126 RepID=A0ABN9U8M6_9DINO|nr:unnamed protein product [Polarella glacialis]
MLPSCPVGSLAVLVMFETYVRPSELLSLAVAQLAPPASEGGPGACRAFGARVEELGRPSETREFDLSMLLDVERRRALIPALRGRLFDISSRQLCRAFADAVERLGVCSVEPTLRALRRGGAGRERLAQARSLGEVEQRGHWRSFRSVARYDKHARVSLQLGELSVALQAEIAGVVGRGARPFSERCAGLLRRHCQRFGESPLTCSRDQAAWRGLRQLAM